MPHAFPLHSENCAPRAVRLAKIGWLFPRFLGAGTWNIYTTRTAATSFNRVNTRIQVEHTVRDVNGSTGSRNDPCRRRARERSSR